MKFSPVLPAVIAISSLSLLNHGAIAAAPPLPPDEAYVTVEGSELRLGGERVRFWGFIGGNIGGSKPVDDETEAQRTERVAKARKEVEIWGDRIADLGFNMYRVWESGQIMADNHNYEVGDGSPADMFAYFFNHLNERGVKLWMSSTNGLGTFTADDVDVIDDPKTQEEWQAAVNELIQANKGDSNSLTLRSGSNRPDGLLVMTDPRVEALYLKRFKELAEFPNKYKNGLRLGDDPQIAVWEMVNEQFPFRLWFGGHWQALPPFFQNQITSKWHEFLKNKYGSDEKLTEAWGFLLPGESLEKANVSIVPLASGAQKIGLNDPNPARWASVQVSAARYGRDKFTRRRGEDVSEFFVNLTVEHKQRVLKAIREMGKSTRLSPVISDAGNDFSIHQAYMHQFADAVATCSYNKGMGHDPTDRRFPFWSLLDEAPRSGWDVPWFEQSVAKGKPHFVYETNTDQRSKYRAEYPLFLAGLASINDWDIILWHSASGKPKDLVGFENPWAGSNAIWHDYLMFRDDEVQNASMRAAGEIFKNSLLKPAPSPTTFIFGSKSLYDPEAMDYGRSFGETGKRFIPTAYRYGAQVVIDPTREDDEIVGPSIQPNVFEPNPVQPHEQISFDRQRGHLLLDAPGVAGYTGFFAQYGADTIQFKNGVTLSDVIISNPDGIAYPVREDEKFFTFSLNSTDGQPLDKTKRAILTAVSTSFNTGFELDVTRSAPGNHREGAVEVPPREYWGAWPSKAGTTPVQVARVGATIHAPAIDGMRYVMRDWHLRAIGEGVVKDGTFQLPADKPVFIVEFER